MRMSAKKLVVLCLALVIAVAVSLVGSYAVSKSVSDKHVQKSGISLTSSGGHLLLFVNDRLVSPRWRFVYEYNNVITGSVYDVQVSLFGTHIETPEDRNRKKERS